MPRIAGVNLPPNKRMFIALTYIYGIGKSLSLEILKTAKVDSFKKAKDLTEEEEKRIQEIIEKNYKVEGDLRAEIRENIKRLIQIGTYRGLRHQKRLPVRGQRTRTNSRTVRGNIRRTMTSGRRKLEKK